MSEHDDEIDTLLKRFIQTVAVLTPERRMQCLKTLTDISECYVDANDKQAVILILEDIAIGVTSINTSFEEASEIVQSVASMFWHTQKDLATAREGSH